MNLTPFPILTSERLKLRKLQLHDSQEIFNLRSDDRVNAYLDRPKAATLQDATDFINKIDLTIYNQQGLYWVITLADDDLLIGTICFYNLDTENSVAEIGFELSPQYQKQGFMQEAIEAVISYGFNVMRLKAITAFPRVDNESSINLLKRNGFQPDPDRKFSNEPADTRYPIYILKNGN